MQLLSAVIAMAAALILLVVTFRLAPAPPARESIWGFPMLGFWFAFVGGTASLLVYRTLRRSVIASILRRNPRTPGIRRFRAMAAQSATSSVFDPITGEPIVGWQVEANTVNYRQSTTTELVKEWTYDPEYGRRQELVPKEVPTTVKEKGIAYRQGQISPFVAVLPDGTPLYVEGDFVVNGKPSGGRHRVSHGGGTAQLQDILRSINAVRFRILTIRFGALVVVTGMVHDEGGHLVVTPIGAPLEAPSTHDDHPDVVSFVRAL